MQYDHIKPGDPRYAILVDLQRPNPFALPHTLFGVWSIDESDRAGDIDDWYSCAVDDITRVVNEFGPHVTILNWRIGKRDWYSAIPYDELVERFKRAHGDE